MQKLVDIMSSKDKPPKSSSSRKDHKESESSSRKPKRYFVNDHVNKLRNPHKQLVLSLNRLVTKYPPGSIPLGGGLYHGTISIAYLFLYLSEAYEDNLVIKDQDMKYWSAAYLKPAKDKMAEIPPPEPDRCGIASDILALVAIEAAATQDMEMVTHLCDFADIVTLPEASNEWLYGRAGYLYLLRYVRSHCGTNQSILELIDETSDEVIDEIMESPRPWKWHDKPYFGAAHGVMGIITQIVLTNPEWAPKLEADLAALLKYQYESGNWPAYIPPGRDKLVQVCHGAPGVVLSLISVREFFPRLKQRIDECIDKARKSIWERGLLIKEPCLCHGISGNALALNRKQFEQFLTWTTEEEIRDMEREGALEKSSDPSGLWTGEAGRAWTWAIADQTYRKQQKTLIGYNDI